MSKIKAMCPSCNGGRKLKQNSKTGRIIKCATCKGSGVIYKIKSNGK